MSSKEKEITKTMLRFKMTDHASQDRVDRLLRISRIVSFGDEIIFKAPSYRIGDGTVMCISDTGVMFVLGEDEKFLITAFLPSESEVHRLEESSGRKVPSWLWAKIHKNEKFHKLVNLGK